MYDDYYYDNDYNRSRYWDYQDSRYGRGYYNDRYYDDYYRPRRDGRYNRYDR